MSDRANIISFMEIPNVGPATGKYLALLGIETPLELIGQDPCEMYRELCEITGKKFDPCLADVFISAVRYMEGSPPKKWWEYTEERKSVLR